ncbi:LysR family transcriptional regulator [Actinoplanes sp. NBRC 101535]|uniref:LysR family transcriptional regulator n=1 Tax=Actinoplanes sp. NBRC 101535 TaxID=3032196 RepID=UPI0024A2AF1B|nr:LysR family transcriptional regulator [Actinoplanes sp. NBRC 101535]GLY08515.1 LysR family transcriptional regulator [Actinoplanes sp. NBRC 101535]
MDARQLSHFLAIVDHLNFNRAAEQLHIAQPSLSQSMSQLERELGVPLFHRVGRGIVLSDAGKQLVEPARQVIRDLDNAKAAVRSVQGLQRGRVELVAMPSPAMEPLGTITRVFTDTYPGMSLLVDAAFTPEEVVHAVKSGQSEVGLLGAASAPHTGGLDVLHIEDQPLVLISPPSMSAASDVIGREDLAGMRLIVSRRGSLMRQLVDDVLASGVDVELVVELEHRTSILPMVLDGVGHAVMPSSWAPLAQRTGARVRRIEPVSLLRISLVTRQGRLTPAAQAFVACVATYARSPV